MTTNENNGTRPDRRTVVFLGFAMALAGVFAYREFRNTPAPTGDALGVTQAHEMAQEGHLLLIDIRRPEEWRDTGVPEGAHPIDMRRDDFVPALLRLAGADPTRPIGLICARGVRSARLASELTQAGFTNVIDVPAGLLGSSAGAGWLAAGLPVRRHPETEN
ncbi:rhodanese-like domain-containing protein [Rhodobacteraceae bacterium F11138]|nr:rhodanese-like domain-containing protein [Rhodobacteraceae bacterium F11138]